MTAMNIFFRDINYLLLLPAVLIAAYVYYRVGGKKASVKFSSGELLSGTGSNLRAWASTKMIFLRTAALCLIAVALARPQAPLEQTEVISEGIDIVLVLDVSTSMLAEDFTLNGKRLNRLDVVKDVVKEFIEKRRSDRIGLVVFAARPYTVCPLTLDYDWLLRNLERVEIGMVEDSTAIGAGLAAALNRIKDTKAKSKVVILLTDGQNNAGRIAPVTAAEAAKSLKVKVYTIGAGSEGLAPYPFEDMLGNVVYKPVKIEIDEKLLRKIAGMTGGTYYRATDTKSLRDIYNEIDSLEKTPVEEKGYTEYKELFHIFLVPGLLVLLLEILLSNTYLRRLP